MRTLKLTPIFMLSMVICLAGLAIAVQLGIHPLFTHPDTICSVRDALCRPDCQPGSQDYKEYWSEHLQQFMITCWLPETGRYAIWIVAKDGPVQFNEVTGFLGRLKYIATVVMRDGYYLVR